ncbi:MAG TPA: L,D-transpeptidase family protein [Gemmatimonadales bacterium]|nr:L,D-transpeptidase family protein [Gemmatimonadales bacterium]
MKPRFSSGDIRTSREQDAGQRCLRAGAAVQRARRRAGLAAALLLASLGQAGGAAAQPGPPDTIAAAAIRSLVVTGRLPALGRPDLADQRDAIERLYVARDWRPLWHEGGELLPAAATLGALLARAEEDGLRAADYDAEWVAGTWTPAGTPPAAVAQVDVGLTVAALRYLHARAHGRVDPRRLGVRLDRGRREGDLPAALAAAVPTGRLAALADSMIPPTYQYHKVREALARYRLLAANPPPAPPLDSAALRPGDGWTGGPALRHFLELTGDLDPGTRAPAEDTTYAGAVVTGLRRFQERHGLEPDGIIGRRTRAALRVPFAARVRQLELALERLRWLPDLRGESFLLVNVPDFTLYAFDAARGSSALPSRWMRVIVGRAVDTETPIFDERMRFVVFRPYWNVPSSIAGKELLPPARRDPGWLDRNGYDLVRGNGPEDGPAVPVTLEALDSVAAGTLRIRQRPGPQNALGRVKFIFPNAESVYLHDTPARGLFARERRDFSHGCIRVADPAWLASWVLRDQPEWSADSVAAAMDGPLVPRTVRLTAPLRVIIFYATAGVRPDARVAFYEDVYGHDRALERAMAG